LTWPIISTAIGGSIVGGCNFLKFFLIRSARVVGDDLVTDLLLRREKLRASKKRRRSAKGQRDRFQSGLGRGILIATSTPTGFFIEPRR
jgi:hypothetical protein